MEHGSPAADDDRFIGVDLGGTHLRVASIDASGAIHASRRVGTARDGGPEAVIAQILQLLDDVGTAGAKSVGIGIPGSIDAVTGTVLGIPALPGWDRIPLGALIRDRAGIPCLLENDATAAAIGEWRAGAAKGCEHFVYVTISTGIGAGVVIDGRVLRGARGLAGEIGHTRIADHSDICSCGKIGCWEAVASGTALGRRGKRAMESNAGSLLAEVSGAEQLSAFHVGLAARRGDEVALALLREEAELLGLGFVNAQHLYAPEKIVVGGGLSSLLDLMQDDIELVVRDRLLPGFPPAPIVVASLGDDAGVIGAALQAASI
ncbi:ROK family protein (plasmid) [Agrobacterium tumefaciens]|nr:ROK family protein [Agrobacterium tumefaciens]